MPMFKKLSVYALVTVGFFGALLVAVPDVALASAADEVQKGINAAGGSGQRNLTGVIRDIVNILLFVIGIASVIMIIIGGLRYVLSGGDAQATKAAKDTVLYAIVGLVVAFLAYAIVGFVTRQIS